MDASQQPQEVTDIFSLSDQVLSERLHFVEEIGFGNWGSVWLCRPKGNPASPSADGLDKLQDAKIAVKLVHRSKTPTTAARVRSLWNEMKIVRSFKNDPHPAIIPFHSFIITPSYALITMAFLPTLVPVEVEESKAREWFRLLLSGVEFLHKRGVVHNDIKPANILLSHRNIPVLVDFGFAEKYDFKSSKAFHSNLSYGTPEYLAPERARGLPHDTRKSDIWSLGVTFFEILIGRTPFEYSDGEQFSTKEDLEKYWSRTLRGKWVGSWKMSKSIEKLLRRMVAPNADLRCTALDAMGDPYWRLRRDPNLSHRRSTSVTSSLVFEDMSKLMNITPPWSSRPNREKENLHAPSQLPADRRRESLDQALITRSKSQPKISAAKAPVLPKKRLLVPPLSPVKASPPPSPHSVVTAKENVLSLNTLPRNASVSREPMSPPGLLNDLASVSPATKPPAGKEKHRRKALMDLTGFSRNLENMGKKENIKAKDPVKERVKEWERERERLREMAQLEEREKERDEELETERKQKKIQKFGVDTERRQEKENHASHVAHSAPRVHVATSPLSPLDSNMSHEDMVSRAENETVLSGLKQTVKSSIDKTMQICKSSTLAQVTGRTTPARSLSADRMDEVESRKSHSVRESWEDDTILRDAKSSLPVVRHAIRNERVAADSRLDRMRIWMQNVEKVVEDARQTFASTSVTPLPPLPLAPLSRSASQNHSNRISRLPRRALAANQIFMDDFEPRSSDQTTSFSTSTSTPLDSRIAASDKPLPPLSADCVIGAADRTMQTPQRARRATVSTRSPEPAHSKDTFDLSTGSPSKRKEKSKSQGNLLQPISPISKLEFELKKQDMPVPTPRLSAVLDRSLFIATPLMSREDTCVPSVSLSTDKSGDSNELTSSPFHVEPYPPRKTNVQQVIPDTPSQRRLEGVYDRFLMATSGVKRLGRGYQSDNAGPVLNNPDPNAFHHKRNPRVFNTTRRRMPPPVSSADPVQTVSVDELGVMTYGVDTPDESNTTAALVRRAFKAIGKTVSRREL